MDTRYKKYEPLFGSWYIKDEIGHGSFGTVYRIEREDFGKTYTAAMKAITIPQDAQDVDALLAEGQTYVEATEYFRDLAEEVSREIALMAELKGQSNIVSYEDHLILSHKEGIGWDILIRMELLQPLNHYLKDHSLDRRDVLRLGIDICRGLELCQRRNIIHRDIKPENIFVSPDGNFKLGDFGVARIEERTMTSKTRTGTLKYMAPEVFTLKYDQTVDLYSLGLVMYQFLNYLRLPFQPLPPEPLTFKLRQESQAVRLAGRELEPPAQAGESLSRVILKACAPKPEDRYQTAHEMRMALEAERRSIGAVPEPKADAAIVVSFVDEMPLSNEVEPAELSLPEDGSFFYKEDTVLAKKTLPAAVEEVGNVSLLIDSEETEGFPQEEETVTAPPEVQPEEDWEVVLPLETESVQNTPQEQHRSIDPKLFIGGALAAGILLLLVSLVLGSSRGEQRDAESKAIPSQTFAQSISEEQIEVQSVDRNEEAMAEAIQAAEEYAKEENYLDAFWVLQKAQTSMGKDESLETLLAEFERRGTEQLAQIAKERYLKEGPASALETLEEGRELMPENKNVQELILLYESVLPVPYTALDPIFPDQNGVTIHKDSKLDFRGKGTYFGDTMLVESTVSWTGVVLHPQGDYQRLRCGFFPTLDCDEDMDFYLGICEYDDATGDERLIDYVGPFSGGNQYNKSEPEEMIMDISGMNSVKVVFVGAENHLLKLGIPYLEVYNELSPEQLEQSDS